jgi:rfaE bifunctional protein nucleotidyltransferase chain/domain/rfaE bifunctional protein kinase chain/domain
MGNAIVRELLPRWPELRVLVVGDALLDGWLTGDSQRLSREAPVPVVAVEHAEYTCGGAANTAANVAALGARAILVAPVGDDPDGFELRRCIESGGVDAWLVEVPDRRTPAKRRLVAGDQIVVRMDEGDSGPIPDDSGSRLRGALDAAVSGGVDAVVVCDYGLGAVDDRVAGWLADRRADLPLLVVDAHDVGRWAQIRPDLVTPSFAEVTPLLGVATAADRAKLVAARRRKLYEKLSAQIVAVTLDVDGAVVLERGAPGYRTYAQPVPANRTAGAGDAYVAGFTLALATGAATAQAAEVAQLAATAATRRPGTAVCDAASLVEVAGGAEEREVDAPTLARLVEAHRAQGRRIVFTNGCFDVLHRGHVGYLNQAKREGDVLIVAVNSDDSVRRLKGPDRPVNPVGDRVAVLAALSCVDHVVVFDEDSPVELLEFVRPDVYVKGGDYRPEKIPEAPLVIRLGGVVRVLDHLPDHSTTQIIGRIRSARP